MSDIKQTFSDTNTSKDSNFNLSSINGVLNVLLSAFKTPNPPVEPLPPPLITVGAKLRPGVSAKEIASRIISRQSEAGLPVGNLFGDGPNTSEAMLLIQIEEIVNSILTESVVNVSIPPGVPVLTVGTGNLGFPVVSMGITTSFAIGDGIIR
jgi:hypothetical protein